MTVLTLLEEVQLHRKVYITALNGLLKKPGAKRALAQKVGITPQYLSYILDPWNIRTPSPRVAEAIVASLPLPSDQKNALLEHMILANERRAQMHKSIRRELVPDNVYQVLDRLRDAHQQATFSKNHLQARLKYKFVCEISTLLIREVNPRRNPALFVELCFLGHDSGCVLNHQIDALWFAKQARHIMEIIDPYEFHQSRERFVDFKINAIRAEAVSCYNLGLHRLAHEHCKQAEALLDTGNFRSRSEFWIPHLYRDKLNALAGMSRFVISEAESLADRTKEVCEKDIHGEEKELLLLLVHSSLARAYITRGGKRNWRKAERVLRVEFERMDKMRRIGPLHRTLLLRTFANLYRAQGDQEGWQHFIRLSIETAIAAGLVHQVQEIRQECEGTIIEHLIK